jgi:hypothetical protein
LGGGERRDLLLAAFYDKAARAAEAARPATSSVRRCTADPLSLALGHQYAISASGAEMTLSA